MPAQPDASIAIAREPVGIPTVSTWGLAVMGLLVVIEGTIVVQRGRMRTAR